MNRNLFIAGLSVAVGGSPMAVVGLLVGLLTGSWLACWVGLGMVVGGGVAWTIGAAATAAVIRRDLEAIVARLPNAADAS